MGVWLSLRILDSWYVSVLEYSTPPEISDPSSSQSSQPGFQFLKITRIARNMPFITNRLKLLTPKVQTLLKSIPQNYWKLLLQKEQQPQLPTFSQDTQLSATGKLSKQDKNENSREFKPQTNYKILERNKHESTRAKHDKSYEKIKNTNSKDKHENPMRCSRLKWSVFISHTSMLGSDIVMTSQQIKAKLKTKERDTPSIAHNA